MAVCLCDPADRARCRDESCDLAGADETCDEPEMATCEHCSKEFEFDNAVRHGDCIFCPQCDADWREHFAQCRHDWEPHSDEYGDAGRYCTNCAGFVCDDVAMSMFPLACDGWADVDPFNA